MRKLSIILVNIIVLLMANVSSASVHSNQVVLGDTISDSTPLFIQKHYAKNNPIYLSYTGISLKSEEGSLLHDMDLRISRLQKKDVAHLASKMVNVTSNAGAYRLLPHGKHFSSAATLELAYDPALLPNGISPYAIYTYWYDEELHRWQRLPRLQIDTAVHTIVSSVTHFTDFINAVVPAPEMPEVSAFVPTAISDLDEPNPLQRINLIAEPKINNYGSADITYPIEIPTGRNNFQPNVSLFYSSLNDNGILGYGWSIPQPAITIDTRWGVPRYDGVYETEIYSANGMQIILKDGNPELKLPYQTNIQLFRHSGNVRFVARDTKNSDRIIRHGNRPSNYWWEITDRDGVTYYYGKYANDDEVNPNCVLKDEQGNIGYWALAEQVDILGNYIRYEYTVSPNHEIYPKTIYYTGHRNNDSIDLAPNYRIFFHYTQRPDVLTDGRLGFVRQTDSLMCYVDITYLPNNSGNIPFCPYVNRRFLLLYDESYPHSLLTQIQDHINNYDVRWPTNGGCEIPSMGYDIANDTVFFEYYKSFLDSAFSDNDVILPYPENSYVPLNKSTSKGWNIGGTLTLGVGKQIWNTNISAGGNFRYSKTEGQMEQMFGDMNGDGLPDLVYIRNDSIRFRLQYQTDISSGFGDENNTGIAAKGLSNENSKMWTWGGQAGVDTYGAYANVSGGRSTTQTRISNYFIDINGDGLPDYVDNGTVYFNRLGSHGDFLKHNNEIQVVLDSSSCNTFIYDGEVAVEPDCYERDTIVGNYYFTVHDCSLDYNGHEPEYIYPPHGDTLYDCELCDKIIQEYILNDKCPIDLYYSYLHPGLPKQRKSSSSNTRYVLDEQVYNCLRYCGAELVCKECLEYYHVPGKEDLYEQCKREKGCRTLCPECISYLIYGDTLGYLACADTFCLYGLLERMDAPCPGCWHTCMDDMDSCKSCILQNPTCFVCDECLHDCYDGNIETCMKCKQTYNCLGAIELPCMQACDPDSGNEYDCGKCLYETRSYCPRCTEICELYPDSCYLCVRQNCQYDDLIRWKETCQQARLQQALDALEAWKSNMRIQYPGVTFYNIGRDYYAHLVDSICPDSKDPDVEAVRVWVAPKNGIISLFSSLRLLEDTTLSRYQSRTTDGIRAVIQHNQNVIPIDTNQLQATSTSILDVFDITANDYDEKTKTYYPVSVKKGDVFFFRLRSRDTHSFDNVSWMQQITYFNNGGGIYSSEDDYICYSRDPYAFQADTTGTIQMDITVRCAAGNSARICVLYGDSLLNSWDVTDSVSLQIVPFPCVADTSLSVTVSPLSGNLGQIEVLPLVTYKRDTISLYSWLTPQYVDSSPLLHNAIYYQLFGTLYRGWGQFSYNNDALSDVIPLNSLVNSARASISTAPTDSAAFAQSILFTENDTIQFMQEDSMEEAFAAKNIYNPLDNAWIPMSPDISHYRWEAYGFIARNGRTLLSNTRDTKAMLSLIQTGGAYEDDDEIEYDSDVPILNGKRVMAVIKTSENKQWNVNAGVGIVYAGIGGTYSEGDYNVTTDFMDMNGDGFPDVVRQSSIQFSQPWGGLGTIKPLSFDVYANHSVTSGSSISGHYAYSQKMSTKDAQSSEFLVNVDGSVSLNATTTNNYATLAYIDVNSDGLPDKLIKQGDSVSVCLNIGYDFASPSTLWHSSVLNEPDCNTSSCVSASLGASGGFGWGEIEEVIQNILGTNHTTYSSRYQVSLSFGAEINSSINGLTTRLLDMNGDGVLDIVRQTGNGMIVQIMSIPGTHQQRSFYNRMIQQSKTLNGGISMGITGGFPIWIFKVCLGLNGSPVELSKTQVTHDLVDMNGDGLPDLVWTADNGIHIRYNRMGKNNLLKSITNPTGQTIKIDYELSSPTREEKKRRWLMTSMDNIDPHAHPILGCDTMRHTFTYSDPHYDYVERQFYGYGMVTQNDIKTDSHPRTEYRRTVRRFQNAAYIDHGKMWYEAIADSTGQIAREYEIGIMYLDTTSVPTDNLCEDAFIRLGEEVHYTRYYEGDDDRIVTAKKYEYDKYHNVVEYTNYGDTVLANDELRATIEYDSTEVVAHNIVSSPSKMVVYSNDTAIREINASYWYGLPIEIRRTDLISNQSDTTDYHYDSFGLPDSVFYPSNYQGERAFTAVKYDMYSHSLPAVVSDQWGRTMQMTYDKFWQIPLSMTDPSGYYMEYAYDTLGRLKTISAPGDTTHYIYHNPITGQDIVVTQRNITLSYSYTPRYLLNNDMVYPSVQTVVNFHPGEIKRSVYCDHRGNVLYRRKRTAYYRGYDWVDNRVFSDICARDCFGRTKAVYRNYIDQRDSDVSLEVDSLQKIASLQYDILDRQTQTLWVDSTHQTVVYSLAGDAFGVKRLCQTQTDERGLSVKRYSAPQGWVTSIVQPQNTVTKFIYDALGQLRASIDPDGLTTAHIYDGLGRRTQRIHPDAGTTRWCYDGNGNITALQTQHQINDSTQIVYEYEYNRLKAIHYPNHPQLDITYTYDSVGRLAQRKDITGYEWLEYDALGNVATSERLIAVPTEQHAYRFKTQYVYDVLGRIVSIIYPDGERVSYSYSADNLYSMRGYTQGIGYRSYIQEMEHDAYDNPVAYLSGNGYSTDFTYDSIRYRLSRLRTHQGNRQLQDIHYTYDAVGNITAIDQLADSVHWLGGAYMQTFAYDSLYRLTKADMLSDYWGEYSDYTMTYSPSGMVGIKSCDDMLWNFWHGYCKVNNRITNHQVRSIYDMDNDATTYQLWNADGQLTDIYTPSVGYLRHHWWNEAGQMAAVADNEHCGFYGYDGNGERAYKLTGSTELDTTLTDGSQMRMHLDNTVLYVNPYFIVTPTGYTKQYYNGMQHIATRIGELNYLPENIIDTSALGMERLMNARSYMDTLFVRSVSLRPDTTATFVDIDREAFPELQWQGVDSSLVWTLAIESDSDMLYPVLTKDTSCLDPRVSGIYYYHSDHLGSAAWVTHGAQAVQFVHYMPFGEMWYNQQGSAYNERYKFTGKERDAETGYDYFGARYYASGNLSWLSVDPHADNYPNISPYAYAAWNPIKYVDPDGRDNYRYDHKTGDFVLQEKTNDNFDQIGKYKYNRKTGEYEPKYYRFKKDIDGKPIQKFYSAHRNTDGKIAKGILSDGLNIKQSGKTFVLNQTSPTEADYFKFALLLDKVAGVEISGYTYNNKAVHFDSYKNNSYNRSKTYIFTFPEGYQNIQHFHTHGHAGYSEAIQPSKDYDIPFKNQMISKNPGKDILFLILHNYGAPIRY